MRIIDVSIGLSSETTVWPGSPAFTRSALQTLEQDGVNVSTIGLDVHSGTHVDAPLHHVRAGPAVDELPLDAMIGPVLVVELPDVPVIDEHVLEASVAGKPKRVLLKTSNAGRWSGTEPFSKDFVALDEGAARWIAEHRIVLVGIDYLSIQHSDATNDVHRILLEAGVVVVEGIRLTGVAPGSYDLVCLPLLIEGAEGSPARVVLIEGGLDGR